jgi:predicted helicase
VEEILSVMNTLDLPKITKSLSYEKFKTKNLFDETNISYKDPYIYFYEHFLKAYDNKLRQTTGVYYTPPQVVSFIVRSISDILKQSFNIDDGFADKDKVTVLDFATGTGTFLL